MSSADTPMSPPVLTRTRELVVPSMRRALDDLPVALRSQVEYHLGWVDLEGNPEGRGGKMVRPALAVLSAEAAGADPSVAIPGAVAVELIHNFSLLHDDIMDGDRERRHRPTVWAAFGLSDAIIAGDALMTLGVQVIHDAPGLSPEIRLNAGRRLCMETAAMIAGQVEDGGFERRECVSWDECVAMERKKTGALLSFASSIGAVLAGAPEDSVERLAGFGMHLGLAFQAVDDLLGIWGDPQVTGKPVSSDLRQAKKSLPITAALESGSPEAEELARLLRTVGAGAELEGERLEEAVGLVEACGGRTRTERFAAEQLERAEVFLQGDGLAPAAVEELRTLGRFLSARTY